MSIKRYSVNDAIPGCMELESGDWVFHSDHLAEVARAVEDAVGSAVDRVVRAVPCSCDGVGVLAHSEPCPRYYAVSVAMAEYVKARSRSAAELANGREDECIRTIEEIFAFADRVVAEVRRVSARASSGLTDSEAFACLHAAIAKLREARE